MKTEIQVSYNYKGKSLAYSKVIELPFAPFFGLGIIINDENETKINLENNGYCRTIIDFNLEKQQFEINVRHFWSHPVSDNAIDCVFEDFADWDKKHDINIDSLKELMLTDYKKGLN